MMRYLISAIVALVCVSCTSSTPPAASALAPQSVAAQGPIITQIVSHNEVIIVRAGATEPTYSLQSKNGEILVPAITAGDLALAHPELLQKVRTMQAATMDASVAPD
jgi:hypothetical protein